MPIGWDDGIAVRDRRAIEQLALRPDSVEPVGAVAFKVRASKGSGFYTIRLKAGVWACDCPDWEDRLLPCKHILQVLHALDPRRTPIEAASLGSGRARQPRNWPAYDKAHRSEPLLFDSLMWDLLEPLDALDPLRPVGRPGRPSTPLRVKFLVAAKYVRGRAGSRTANGELGRNCKEFDSLISGPLNSTAPSRLFNTAGVAEILLELIERSSMVLAEIEDGGTVAVDSTGFCVECRGSYCTEKHNPGRRHTWVKAHLVIGVKTHVILTVKITDEHGADYPEFLELLKRVIASGHRPRKIAGDRAYLGRGNIDGAIELGVDPVIPFKVNSVARAKGSPAWRQKYHEFMTKRDEFDRAYHLRSNIESVNSAVKRTLGEHLLSHNSVARFNELLMRLLCYNIRVVVAQAFELGISPSVEGAHKAPGRVSTRLTPDSPGELISPRSKESAESGQLP